MSIANSTRKRTRTQINAHKLIVVMDAWVISASKCDCDLKLRMYYTYVCMYVCIAATPGIFIVTPIFWFVTWIRRGRCGGNSK